MPKIYLQELEQKLAICAAILAQKKEKRNERKSAGEIEELRRNRIEIDGAVADLSAELKYPF